MTRDTFTHSIVAAALILFAGTSFALANTNTASERLSAEEAIAIALAAQPGTIGEAELDTFEGKPAYDIEVINDAGDEIEFKIDAANGEILNVWTDDDPSDDPVSANNTSAGD